MRLHVKMLASLAVLLSLQIPMATTQPIDCHRSSSADETPLNGTTTCFTGYIKGVNEVASMIQSWCRVVCDSKLPISDNSVEMGAVWWVRKEGDGDSEGEPVALNRNRCVSAFGMIRNACRVSWGIGPTGGNFTSEGFVYGVRFMSGQGIVKEW